MVELRKRKAPAELVHLGPTKKGSGQIKDSDPKAKVSTPATRPESKDNSFAPRRIPRIGDTISLETFGGEIKTHEGTPVTLKALVDRSKSGVVLFTYPKASTPGCKYHDRFFLL
jgi:peroxiredoxin Q/BCP